MTSTDEGSMVPSDGNGSVAAQPPTSQTWCVAVAGPIPDKGTDADLEAPVHALVCPVCRQVVKGGRWALRQRQMASSKCMHASGQTPAAREPCAQCGKSLAAGDAWARHQHAKFCSRRTRGRSRGRPTDTQPSGKKPSDDRWSWKEPWDTWQQQDDQRPCGRSQSATSRRSWQESRDWHSDRWTQQQQQPEPWTNGPNYQSQWGQDWRWESGGHEQSYSWPQHHQWQSNQ